MPRWAWGLRKTAMSEDAERESMEYDVVIVGSRSVRAGGRYSG